MADKPKILIAEPDGFDIAVVKRLRRHAEVDLINIGSQDVEQALIDYDVFWFRLAHRIDHRVLSDRSRCKYLVTPVTGVDHIDEALCRQLGVRLLCLRGERAFLREVRATAEMTIGLAIALMRHIPKAADHVSNGGWDRDLFRGHELYKKTVGIVGFGRLGEIAAHYFHAFGMRVMAFDPAKTPTPDYVERVDEIERLFGSADVISIHVNYSEQTHHLIDAGLLSACKPNAVLINTSRGGIVDEDALLRALRNRQIAGAALDVLSGEPYIDSHHSLVRYARAHDNLLIVPHIGGNTFESFEKTEHFMADKLLSFIGSEAIA